MDEDYREALIDELMALIDFGQAIEEPYVALAGRRCLWLIIVNEEVKTWNVKR